MILIALALAAAAPSPSKAYVVDVCLERDNPRACIRAERNRLKRRLALVRFFMRQGGYSYRSAEEVANWHGARLTDQILAARLCGPEDVAEVGTTRGHPRCNRYGWNGRRYVGRRP